MHSDMCEYSMDFEDKLEKTYAAIGGQVKKFGFGDMMSQKLPVVGEGEEFLTEKFDRDLEQMNQHARHFV